MTFPRQEARTRGFTLGQPRSFAIAPDGGRVAFLRSAAGDDPVNALWVLDLASGAERRVVHPSDLTVAQDDVPDAERARRERARERANGIVAYATDDSVRTAVFALDGRLFVADLLGGGPQELPKEIPTAGPAFDPRPDPTGRRVAYATGGSLHVVGVEDGSQRLLAGHDDPDVTWGLAEFVAAEEMGRARGFWWSPDGSRLAVARVDNRPVERWHLTDPADPSKPPVALRYPAAGTANAVVSLSIVDVQVDVAVGGDGDRVDVGWDSSAFPYLVEVTWASSGPLTVVVQSRDQRTVRVLTVDDRGATAVVREDRDPTWLEVVPGVPVWLDGGQLAHTVDCDDTRRLAFDGEPVTPAGLQVRRVVGTGTGSVVVAASEEPTEVHLYRVSVGGTVTRLTTGPGVHTGVARGDVVVVSSSRLDEPTTTVVHRSGGPSIAVLSLAEEPEVRPRVSISRGGARALRTAVLLPDDGGQGRDLPVLVDPYGGPHAQRVLSARGSYLVPQWFADQGFAVVVTDGRGTPGRGLAWERSVRGDLAGPVLEDQVDALLAVAEQHPQLDLGRVAIRGWSFGGYLAALAVLRRPDVFHAAVAGAPVSDWRLYDTHYTERYLGCPDEDPDAYRRSSLLDEHPSVKRPILLVHGLADDNVVAAHTLRLSSALLASGHPHAVLPLTGVTHMASQEVVAENLLLLQLHFLTQALGTGAGGTPPT